MTMTPTVTFTLALTLSIAIPGAGFFFPQSWWEAQKSDGVPLETLLNELSGRVTLLTASQKGHERLVTDLKIQLAQVSEAVAFTVSTSAVKQQQQDAKAEDNDSPYVFDHVMLDSDECYDNKTGFYLVLVPGSYALSVEVTQNNHLPTATENKECLHVALLYEDERKLTTASTCFNDKWSASNVVVLRLAKGDRIYAKLSDQNGQQWLLKNNVCVTMAGKLL